MTKLLLERDEIADEYSTLDALSDSEYLILGVTGTRHPTLVTGKQYAFMRRNVELCSELHTGAATGADETAFDIAVKLHHIAIVVHPPINETFMMAREKWLLREGIYVREQKDYLARDRDCVDESEWMIALPDGPRKPRSGTWYTIDYAIQVGVPGELCFPDGTVKPFDEVKR